MVHCHSIAGIIDISVVPWLQDVLPAHFNCLNCAQRE